MEIYDWTDGGMCNNVVWDSFVKDNHQATEINLFDCKKCQQMISTFMPIKL